MSASWHDATACIRVRHLSLALALVSLHGFPGPVAGQSYRGWAGTSVQVVEMRPFGLDSVPRSEVVTDFSGRLLHEGQEVTCVTESICTGYLPLPKARAVAATQDLGVTFWGLGMRGLSATSLLRVRARGGGFAWPRTDDEFDAILAYGQLQRGALRVRAGRQEVRSGLGFSGFDGLSGAFERGSFWGEVYGGRSLARGLRAPANEAFRGLEDFFVDESALLIGIGASGRRSGTLVTGRYQREIYSDRSGLVSERAALDVSTLLPRLGVTGAVDYDFSFERVGKAHLTLSLPLADRWLFELSGVRYVPYFDLSTLWGFFEPVSYSEVAVRAGWSPRADLGLRLSGGWRTYGDTATPIVLQPLRDTGWRVDLRARWQPATAWAVDGHYDLEWGPGGFLSTVDAAVRYSASDRLSGSLSVLTFQKLEEYRLGEGRAVGGGASGDFALTERLSLAAGYSIVRHRDGGSVVTSPWDQSRGWTSLRVELGREAGRTLRRSTR